MKRPQTRQVDAALTARRALVLKNMCDLMKAMNQDDKFDNPEVWINSIIERPRRAVVNSSTPKRRTRLSAQT